MSTQPFKGLLVANLILNNWDWKTSNNKVYDLADRPGASRRVFVAATRGCARQDHVPAVPEVDALRGMGQGSRNDVAGFEEQALIKKVEGQRVTFDYRGIHNGLVDTLTVDDVVWTCRLMARISDRQRRDAFRAAGVRGRGAAAVHHEAGNRRSMRGWRWPERPAEDFAIEAGRP